MFSINPTKRVCFVSSYVPRQCGIATFTNDLVLAISKNDKHNPPAVIAIEEAGIKDRPYPPEVEYQINQDDSSSYAAAARYINSSGIDIVSLQHEYGLYGGKSGCMIFDFISLLKKPVVTTFHTVLVNPSQDQRQTASRLAQKSFAVVVMIESAAKILVDAYQIPRQKIAVIPHGAPYVPRRRTLSFKKDFGLENLFTISTFGLINPGKGIEYVIEAMPAIIRDVPNACLLVLGATHPNLIKLQGESYRQYLVELASRLSIENQVRFINRYLTLDEISRYLGATDIYISAYVNPEQIASGTLSYALGAGKVCISTPYIYARETLADNRGIMVPFRDSDSLATASIDIAKNPGRKKHIEKNAYKYSRKMLWPNVASQYSKLFKKAKTTS